MSNKNIRGLLFTIGCVLFIAALVMLINLNGVPFSEILLKGFWALVGLCGAAMAITSIGENK